MTDSCHFSHYLSRCLFPKSPFTLWGADVRNRTEINTQAWSWHKTYVLFQSNIIFHTPMWRKHPKTIPKHLRIFSPSDFCSVSHLRPTAYLIKWKTIRVLFQTISDQSSCTVVYLWAWDRQIDERTDGSQHCLMPLFITRERWTEWKTSTANSWTQQEMFNSFR